MHRVIIIGGGPVGLTTSIALSQQNIPHVLFEKHPSTAIFPKAVGLNQRTIEFFRSLGLEEEVTRAAAPPESVSQTTWYTSLGPNGQEILTRDAWGGGQYADEYARNSPSRYSILPQIRLEPILHRRALELNPDGVINNATVVGVEDLPHGARVHVRFTSDQSDNTVRTFDAQYVVAADGGRMVADALGIAVAGERDVMEMVSGHVQAPISQFHPQPGALITWFIDPELGGSINTGYLYHLGPYPAQPETEEWLFACGLLPGESRDFTEEMMLARLHRTLKIPELEVKLKSISHWNVNAVVAERYRSRGGRVFLVGDAAHRFPPWGALGLNTGLQDVHNLTWKLAMVLREGSVMDERKADALLNTYEAERRPIAQRAAHTSLTNLRAHGLAMDRALGIRPEAPPAANVQALQAFLDKTNADGDNARAAVVEAQRVMDTEFHAPGLEIGWFYANMDWLKEGIRSRHGGQIREDGEFDITDYYPSALPGHHLPHKWIQNATSQISTRDLMVKDKCVLIAAAREPWDSAASRLVHVDVPSGILMDLDGGWRDLTGLDRQGAVLVRPDGIVLWRFREHDRITKRFIGNPDEFVGSLLLSIPPTTEEQHRG
ncbi:FAD binding domain-containing protein [Aspergillus ambiguus]|uniref:FAD binding domain-containing protein n=1 Tax=Aspergillus ambiguus TaxID=176160 RepID=UPI003CCCA64E